MQFTDREALGRILDGRLDSSKLKVLPTRLSKPATMNYLPTSSMAPAPGSIFKSHLSPNGVGAQLQYTRATSFDAVTTGVSWVFCSVVLLLCLGVSRDCIHWFVVPVFACGVLICHDAVNWLRSRLDPFDPVGLLGVFGIHFFFVAPLLHVVWQWWLPEPNIRPADLRPWLGWMACLNLSGLLIYRYLRDPLAGRVKGNRKVWIAQPGRFWLILPILLLLSAVLQGLIYTGRGGLVGYAESYTRRDAAYQTESGQVAMIAESFPILAMMGYAVLARRRRELASWPALALLLAVMMGLVLFFGGLKGSRSNSLYQFFWIAGIIHFAIRPLSKKTLFVGLAAIVFLGYAYTLVYKAGGLRSLRAFQSGADFSYLERKTGRNIEGMLLGDLGRADMQAFILRQSLNPELEYDFGLGRTYYATLTRIVPSFVWPDRPLLKPFEGTEIQWGKGSYHPRNRAASYVYGLAAEAILNFGPVAVPFAFLVWTFIVARGRKWILSLQQSDVRRLLSPLVALLCIAVLNSDSDNIFFIVFKWGTVPFLLLWFCSWQIPLRQYAGRAMAMLPQRSVQSAVSGPV